VAVEEPIQRRKLSSEVTERLMALVEQRGLKPGDPLPSERELMELYGVGRPSIREALQNLARLGLISIQHGERSRVAEPSMQDVLGQMNVAARHVLSSSPATLDHLKDARLAFELEMVRRAAAERTDEQVEAIAGWIEAQRRHRQEPRKFLELDGMFHREIAMTTGNPVFVAVSEAVFGWLAEFHAGLVRVPGLENLTVAEHGRILEAIRASDPDAAVAAMRDHLTRANTLYAIHGG
jgi:DNA-binding FadR family transcriptional regulator